MVFIQILFNNRSAVFYPGQHIIGNVKVATNSNKSSKGVIVKFKGKAKVRWSQRRGRDKSVTYRAEEEYYEMNCYVWGNGSRQILQAGEHTFPFDFALPLTVPGSYESQTGRVKHECSAKLVLTEAFDKKKTVLFSVNPMYDLNTDPLAAEPLTGTKHKMICCLCCKSGPISLTLNVAQSGFVCGEVITIFAECSNFSTRLINSTSASVYQKVTYLAQGHRKHKNKLVCEVTRPGIEPGDSDAWCDVRLVIPPVPPSHLPGCAIINIDYEFRFSACPSGGLNLTIKKPIIIGTIPLLQNFSRISNVRQPELSYTTPSAPPSQPDQQFGNYTSDPPNYLSIYPDCPPPTYDECKSMGDASSVCSDSNDEEAAVVPFKPRYVCYGFL